MDWLVFAIIAALLATTYTFFDNYLVDVFFKGRSPQAQKCFFGPAYLLVAILLLIFVPMTLTWQNALMLIGAGIMASASYIFYYAALGKDNATGVTLLEQLSPIFYLLFGILLLDQKMDRGQLIGLAVILTVPFIIFCSAKKSSRKTQLKTIMLMLIKVIISAVVNVLIVKCGAESSFTTVLAYVMLGKGIGDTAMMLVMKSWRQRFRTVRKREKKSRFFGVLALDCLTWIASDFIYYIALTLSPAVAIGSATIKALQPIFVFIFGIILTLIWPNFGREKIDRRTVRTHLIATIVAVTGIALMYML